MAQRKGLLESGVVDQLVGFMQAEGWTPKRNQVARVRVPPESGGKDRFFAAGKKGEADWTFVKYLRCRYPGLTLTCHVEAKRERGGVTSPEQIQWRMEQEARGAVVFHAKSIDQFKADYYRVFGWVRGFLEEVA